MAATQLDAILENIALAQSGDIPLCQDTGIQTFFVEAGFDSPFLKELEGWIKRDDIDMILTVDEGDDTWNGPVGLVTTIMDGIDMNYSRVKAIVCGPPIMMRFATIRLLEMGFSEKDIYLSLEKNMSCGLGKCGHCMMGNYYVCKDGPVFRYDEVKELPDLWQ